jgi:hypothetical protein
MASDKSVSIQVTGLRELSSALKQVGAEAPIEMKSAIRRVVEGIAGTIRGKFPHKTGSAASSVVSRASARGGAIAFGGQAAPYAPWLDFGGSVGKGHKPGVAWSGSVKRPWEGKPSGSGRYTYPTISEARKETDTQIETVVLQVARNNGFEVH